MKTTSAVFLALTAVSSLAACSAPGTDETAAAMPPRAKTDVNHAAIRAADGTYSLYTGAGILTKLQNGESLEATPYMMVRASADVVEAARSSSGRVLSFSMEEPTSDIEITVNWQAPPETPSDAAPEFSAEQFRPGDPWLTGIVQVYVPGDDLTAMGLFEVTKWVRAGDGAFASQIHATGLAPDAAMPTLRYGGRPSEWPELPANWR